MTNPLKNILALAAAPILLGSSMGYRQPSKTANESFYVFNIHKLSKHSYQCVMTRNPKSVGYFMYRERYVGKGSTPKQAKLNAIIASEQRKK